MLYRPYGKTGYDVSAFGVGLMRLPTVHDADGNTKIDREEAIRMVDRAVEGGVNYFDTAYVYHNEESEGLLGEALKRGGYRDKVKIATKLPVWLLKGPEDAEKMLDEELKRLGVDKIDVYLMHALDKGRLENIKKWNLMEKFRQFKAGGEIGAIAFSFHDSFDVFKEIIDTYPDDWDMAQIQLNYLDENNQATVEGLKYAASKGLAVVIMEPLRGGNIVNVPEDVKAVFDGSPVKHSSVEWAFRWLYNFPEVTTILSGVSNMEQLEENLRIFDEAKANSMSKEELAIVKEAKETFEKRVLVGCTGCAYCMPCPAGVDIPSTFSAYNQTGMFATDESGKNSYSEVPENARPTSCIECGACESVCPQSIKIIEMLKKAHAALV